MEDRPTASQTSLRDNPPRSRRTLVASFPARTLGWEGAALCMGSSRGAKQRPPRPASPGGGKPRWNGPLAEPVSQPFPLKGILRRLSQPVPVASCYNFIKLTLVKRSTGTGGQWIQQQATGPGGRHSRPGGATQGCQGRKQTERDDTRGT